MKKSYAYMAALAILGAVPLASIGADYGAASPAVRPLSQFGTVDTDRDGAISRAEAQASEDLSARFDQLDADGNGELTLSEWQADSSRTGAAGVSGASRFGAASDIPVMIP